jgi:hypothetical protein
MKFHYFISPLKTQLTPPIDLIMATVYSSVRSIAALGVSSSELKSEVKIRIGILWLEEIKISKYNIRKNLIKS